MDSFAELEDIVAGMNPYEFYSTLLEAVKACAGEDLDPLSPPAPAPAAPQPIIQYMWPVDNGQVLMAVRQSAAATQQIIDVPMVNIPEGQHLRYVRMLNGQEYYEMLPAEVPPSYFPPPVPAAPSLSYNSKKRRRNKQQDKSYVRKPLNAFMLYMKEQRALVKAEVVSQGRGTAAVNKILGQRWKAMTDQDKAKYFSQAEEERWLHTQQHPSWSNKDNYGRKIRKRGQATSSDEASAPATRQGLNAVETAPSFPEAARQTMVVQLPHLQRPVTMSLITTEQLI